MTKKLTLITLLILTSLVSAQKVDLDRERVKNNYIKLPTKPILDFSKHTYSVKFDYPGFEDRIKIHGFKKVDENGTVDIEVTFRTPSIDNLDIQKEKHEKKNKEGKIVSTRYTYTAKMEYSYRGTVSYTTPDYPNGYRSPILQGKTSTKTFNTYKEAKGYIDNNKYVHLDKYRDDVANEKVKELNTFFNRKYGYEEWWHTELFWILDSNKNPDYEGHKKALKDIKALFTKIKIDSKVKDLTPEVEKLEKYFLSIIPKYPKSKRKHRKMRYASYFNIAKLYLTIENFDKAKEYAQKVIDNDYDKRDGKKIIKTIDALKEAFATNKVTTRHFKVEIPSGTVVKPPVKKEEIKK